MICENCGKHMGGALSGEAVKSIKENEGFCECMNCDVCGTRNKEVINLPLYTKGSEGTNVCLFCRITLSNLLQRMMHSTQKSYMRGYKNGKGVQDKT